MRIVLVHPAGSNWVPGKKDISPTANRMAPLGILSMAACLEQAGHRVSVYDGLGPNAPRNINGHVERILSHSPDLVGVSATTSGFLHGYEIAQSIKRKEPQTRIVFGGVHVSSMGGVLLEGFEDIDYLCLGEGEITLSELAGGKDPAEIDGLVWKDRGRPVTNPPRAPISDLDTLPFPAYEKLTGFPAKYHLPLFSYIHRPGATMITSRGCVYRCSYCDRSVFKQGFRSNSAEYVYDHMKYLHARFGVRHISIYDDLFTMDRKRIERLCGLLTSAPLGVQFNCAVRVGHVDEDLLRMLKRAGCLMISVGIETGDQALMGIHKPGIRLEEARETVRRIQEAGLRAKGLFMMGLPGETEASIQKTSDFILSLGLDDMNMSKFTPFHGAPVWPSIREQGEMEEDWRKMNCLNFVFLPKGIDSRKTLDRLYNRHVKRFYTDPSWRKRFRKRLWQHRHSLWHMIRHLPAFLTAKRHFEPGGTEDASQG
ncbi:MAG: radical SAM protein [Desulfatiglandales bacterium]